MKKHTLAIITAAILFVIPFFWFRPGFIDLGGDAGRLYFLEPFTISKNLLQEQNIFGSSIYAIIPYQIFLGILKQIVLSPTLLVALEHGLQLSLGFFFIYLTVKQICTEVFNKHSWIESITAVLCGIVYVGFITKTGWVTSLEIFNQVFLNPLIFYLLFRFFLTSNILYAGGILVLTLLYSENFGFSAMPQLLSFYPFALLFLVVFFLLVIKKPFPWKNLFVLGLFYVGFHAFHFIPMIASILDTKGVGNAYIFSKIAQTNAGAEYFDANRQTLGKLSWGLFQPIKWHGQTILIAIIPIITFLGFLIKRNKLLLILGCFFLISFFLVSANITILGVKLNT